MYRILCLFAALTITSNISPAATISDQVKEAGESGKYVYVMFYRSDDAQTQAMTKTIESQVAEVGEKTSWVKVNVQDSAEAELIKRFDATRLPMPTVFGVAPNGAVTGVYRQKVTPQNLNNAILTPQYSDMVKSLQSQKIAVVSLLPTADSSVPAAVTALKNDPLFKDKIYEVKACATDDAEEEFFRRMQVKRDLKAPVVLMFAPPGTYLGTFDSNVTGSKLAQTLHASGSCNCSKCQHNHK